MSEPLSFTSGSSPVISIDLRKDHIDYHERVRPPSPLSRSTPQFLAFRVINFALQYSWVEAEAEPQYSGVP